MLKSRNSSSRARIELKFRQHRLQHPWLPPHPAYKIDLGYNNQILKANFENNRFFSPTKKWITNHKLNQNTSIGAHLKRLLIAFHAYFVDFYNTTPAGSNQLFTGRLNQLRLLKNRFFDQILKNEKIGDNDHGKCVNLSHETII